MSLKVSKSFVVDADLSKAYDIARDFFLAAGYSEQSAIKPTLLVFRRRGSLQTLPSEKTEDYRISLRVSFNPVGDLQLYTTALLTVRSEYEVRALGGTVSLNERAVFEKEIERLKSHLTKTSQAPTAAETSIPSEEKIGTKLPGRVATGYSDLDNLLFGGIPEKYAVLMTSPSCDERDLLIKRFLEDGSKKGQITFFVTTEASRVKTLVEDFQSSFYLFICNPRADTMIENFPNVFKLKGVENLIDIDIALNKAVRGLDGSSSGPRRACIEIVSDVLLRHRPVSTRGWLSGLIPDLRSRGFTTIAVMNPLMHPSEETQAILSLFEGEISIYEKETENGLERLLKIRKMYNQRYVESALLLKKEKPET